MAAEFHFAPLLLAWIIPKCCWSIFQHLPNPIVSLDFPIIVYKFQYFLVINRIVRFLVLISKIQCSNTPYTTLKNRLELQAVTMSMLHLEELLLTDTFTVLINVWAADTTAVLWGSTSVTEAFSTARVDSRASHT